jgi:hypothetical protein
MALPLAYSFDSQFIECCRTAVSKLSFVNGFVRYSLEPTMRPRARSNNPSFEDSMTTGVL